MIRQTRHPLAIALTVALGVLSVAQAQAQQQAGTTSMREQRAKRMAELNKGKEEAKQEEQKPAAYPNATRVQPEAKASGSLIEAAEVAEVLLFMLTRPRGMTIRDVVLMPTNFDL